MNDCLRKDREERFADREVFVKTYVFNVRGYRNQMKFLYKWENSIIGKNFCADKIAPKTEH